ncbi:MAG: homoserine O-acetyltransferase [Spirochaetales bacterium]|nr:homoserine O-acetyltransferase [Spirochaetales bacterium]
MGKSGIESSDDLRAARPLEYGRTFHLGKPVSLEKGGVLENISVFYETYGALNREKSNAVLIFHALSGDSHVASHDETDDPGWWEIAVGPGKPVDTEKYFVICANVLGGCRGTTGPNSINPLTGQRYGIDFPVITIDDMTAVQYRLIEYLGVGKLLAVIGGSMGGHLVLSWARQYPDSFGGAIAIATSPRLTSQALAFDIVGRNAIMHDPNFRNGMYTEAGTAPDVGLAIARMIGHITYLSRESMQEKFEADRNRPKEVVTRFESRFSVGSYLGYQGDKFVERFDALSYIFLTLAMDMFSIGVDIESIGSAFGKAAGKWLVMSFSSDWLFPEDQSRLIVDSLISRGKEVSYCHVTSSCGHDAFLLKNNIDTYGEMIRFFLDNLDIGGQEKGKPSRGSGQKKGNMTSVTDIASNNIFTSGRIDYEMIIGLIPEQSSVLDLGCGRGELLSLLKERGHKRLSGVEIDESAILSCAGKGLNVIHADLNNQLRQFTDRQYDIVVLSQTLQVIDDIEGLLCDIVRVGKKGIISIPNFAYYKLRRMLYHEGRAPESPGVLKYKWYNTPNRRFMSIDDVKELCRLNGIRVRLLKAFDTEEGKEVGERPNYYADIAVMVISR